MIVLVKNNTKPDLTFVVKRGGVAVPLAGATVTFKLKKPSGATLTKTMTIQGDPAKGKVACAWGVGDLDEAGPHTAEVKVDFGGGAVQNGKYAIPVYVRDEFQESIG